MSECKLKNPGLDKAEDTAPFTAIIACGNSNRSDDGVASYVVKQLANLPNRADVRLFDTGTNGMEVMFKARGCSTLILIDASDSGQAPGTLCKVPGAELERIPEPGLNLHNFRWENALYAGQRIFGDEFPNDISVYLIEAENLGLGLRMGMEKHSLLKKSSAYSRCLQKATHLMLLKTFYGNAQRFSNQILPTQLLSMKHSRKKTISASYHFECYAFQSKLLKATLQLTCFQ